MNTISVSDAFLEKQMLFFVLLCLSYKKLSVMSIKMVCARSALSGNKFRLELNPRVHKNCHLVITYKDYVD